MSSRTLVVFGLALGLPLVLVAGPLSSSAHAINEYHLLAMDLQADAMARESRLEYGSTTGGQFAPRSSWIDLRLRTFTPRQSGNALITAPRAAFNWNNKIRYAPTNRVGGLGRQISSGAPSVSLGRITSGGSGGEGSTPSFGSLHESSSSFEFNRPLH